MATQQSTTAIPTKTWLQKLPVKAMGMCVAGLIAVATLLFTSFINSKNSDSRTGFSLTKKSCGQGGASCTEQKKQSIGASTFTLMPGRLNRFLQ